jgi:hypothetical protein
LTASTGAPASSNNRRQSALPVSAAACSGVQLSAPSEPVRQAPAPSSSRTHATCASSPPSWHATYNGVVPSTAVAFASAPAASSISQMFGQPYSEASASGVKPPRSAASNADVPVPSSKRTTLEWPLMQANINAVVPSSSETSTAEPSARSASTVAVWPASLAKWSAERLDDSEGAIGLVAP